MSSITDTHEHGLRDEYIYEKDLISKYGDMTMDKFREYFPGSTLELYGQGNVTVKQCLAYALEKYKGYYRWALHYLHERGEDIQQCTYVLRESEEINVRVKPRGESRSWLEIGTSTNYQGKFGKIFTNWTRDPLRYPLKDKRLRIRRIFVPHEYPRWNIFVPVDYPLEIRVISRGPICHELVFPGQPDDNERIDTTERTIWTPKTESKQY